MLLVTRAELYSRWLCGGLANGCRHTPGCLLKGKNYGKDKKTKKAKEEAKAKAEEAEKRVDIRWHRVKQQDDGKELQLGEGYREVGGKRGRVVVVDDDDDEEEKEEQIDSSDSEADAVARAAYVGTKDFQDKRKFSMQKKGGNNNRSGKQGKNRGRGIGKKVKVVVEEEEEEEGEEGEGEEGEGEQAGEGEEKGEEEGEESGEESGEEGSGSEMESDA